MFYSMKQMFIYRKPYDTIYLKGDDKNEHSKNLFWILHSFNRAVFLRNSSFPILLKRGALNGRYGNH